MTFGERLKNLRTNFDYTQDIVEQITGLARITISAYENNEKKPSFSNLKILFQVYKTSLDKLCNNNSRRYIDITNDLWVNISKILRLINEDNSNFS